MRRYAKTAQASRKVTAKACGALSKGFVTMPFVPDLTELTRWRDVVCAIHNKYRKAVKGGEEAAAACGTTKDDGHRTESECIPGSMSVHAVSRG